MNENQISEILAAIGPAIKGSLVEAYKPCIRPGCKACKSGEKHRAFMFHYMDAGKRRCMYVPLALVPALQQALHNGRLIEECLHKAGPVLIKEFREKSGCSDRKS
jgi:hypothetical protein